MAVKTLEWDKILESARPEDPKMAFAAHTKVARTVGKLLESGDLPEKVKALNVCMLRSFTAEPLVPSLVTEFALRGFAAKIDLGQLGNSAAEIFQKESFVYRGNYDLCLLVSTASTIFSAVGDAKGEGLEQEIQEYVQRIIMLAQQFKGIVVAANLPMPDTLLAGHFQAQNDKSVRYLIEEGNRTIGRLAKEYSRLVVCDLDFLCRSMGLRAFWSPRDRATSLQPFSAQALTEMSCCLATAYELSVSTPVKCIVLDCDNTLWGGVVGEDGVDGIQLGETYPGTCFETFQQQVLALKDLGYVLAINSKNNEDDVRAVFENHPHSVLSLDDFVARRVNWQDKVSNLQAIAEELNIGLDSLVMIDDSDFELNLIRENLPQVRCLQAPKQPWELPQLLPSTSFMDRLKVTDEDRAKTKLYEQERQRKDFKSNIDSYEGYLKGLKMVMTIEMFQEKHLARAAQLTQKTNQFNLTTRRYSEKDVEAALEEGARIWLGSLEDKFGDYGRIILAIFKQDGQEIILDTFLMSCRAIGRKVEHQFLEEVLIALKAEEFEKVRASFIPTAKNAPAKEFLKEFGFEEDGEKDGTRHYSLDLEEWKPQPQSPIEVYWT